MSKVIFISKGPLRNIGNKNSHTTIAFRKTSSPGRRLSHCPHSSEEAQCLASSSLAKRWPGQSGDCTHLPRS